MTRDKATQLARGTSWTRRRLLVWWAGLVVLTGLAIAAPYMRRDMPRESTPTRATIASAVESVRTSPAPAPAIAASVSPTALPDVPDGSSANASRPSTTDASWPEAARYVLHVGDTSLGFEQGLALEMKERFTAAGLRYEAVTQLDGGLHDFATSKKLAELVRWKKPDVVLLTLGMNNLTAARPGDYEVDVRSIVDQVGDRTCWWIGPLSIGRPETGLIAMLGRATAPCQWTSSYDLEIERQPDHLHPTQAGASRWADAIWTALGIPDARRGDRVPAPN